MQPLPHNYVVTARSQQEGDIVLDQGSAEGLISHAPPGFGGPEGYWSPEDLFVGAVADCFILTFRAIARASKLEWQALECSADGVLDKADGKLQFTGVTIKATLTVAADVDASKAERLLHKAEENCLVTNSMKCPVSLEVTVNSAA